jgi:hypothetical protein
MRRAAISILFLLLALALTMASREPQTDSRLKNAFRRHDQNGWIFVHLEGSPAAIGYQHGYLLASEILDTQREIKNELAHDEKKEWQFFREAAKDMLWPRIEQEYRDELQGIADGVRARNVKLDLWDIVALNAWLEWPYYDKFLEKQEGKPARPAAPPERCSAFVATGKYTKDGRPVMGHNAWTSYMSGERWNVVFDMVPQNGQHIIMDGMPGLIHSGDDFGLNSAGIMITETTISRFAGWNSNGIAEFVRARKAMQYSRSIDDFSRIMQDGNNGGYANDWLVADNKTGEVASLELGLKNVTLDRTKDGYFVGANFTISEKLTKEETEFDPKDLSHSSNARHIRWTQLMEQNKGKIDVESAHRFLADHFDTYQKKVDPDERTLCGHIDLSARGSQPWQPPYGIAGAVQAKATDAALADHMSMTVALGHACGINFKASEHLRRHPEFAWQKDFLRDMPSRPWTTFSATQRGAGL